MGTIACARRIGKKGSCLYIWQSCEECSKERWVVLKHGKPKFAKCPDCARKHLPRRSSRWIGDKYRGSGGYMWVKLYRDDFFYPMTSPGGMIMEHRLAMAKYLRRLLQSCEFVHHKNGIKDDNRLENLELSTRGAHIHAHSKGYQDGYLKGLYDGHEVRIKQLESRVIQLEAENILFKTQQETYSNIGES